ncbi:MAG: dihydroorotate dehydrogenase electron transfer subunit [Euryarchaeota archaeon]|nr:dihydroorotate dehydrogenase electron transfer subunit [Euryarchaeota archaeon]
MARRLTHRPRIVTITGKRAETPLVSTLRWRDATKARPGQYVMVWVPGVDEVPMSLCDIGGVKGIAVHAKGEATSALARLRAGDRIGIRGPYGHGFRHKPGKCLVVAGGTGIACLAPLVEKLARRWPRPSVVVGARTRSELLFVERMRRTGAEVVVTTDDGTAGRKGLATDAAYELLNRNRYSQVCSCGPEAMMRVVASLAQCQSAPVQLSLERYMKCGIGICDSCAMGGLHICVEGPVMDSRRVAGLPDFGAFRRDACGRKERM